MGVYDRFVKIGRVVFIKNGSDSGRLASIVEVIDGNRILVDGPVTGVKRQPINLRNIDLTKMELKIRHGCRTGTLKKAWEGSEVRFFSKVELIYGNRILVDGPVTGAKRQPINLRNIDLTKMEVKIRHGCRTGTLKKAWEGSEVRFFSKVELIYGNRILVDGPVTGAKRQPINLRNIDLTKMEVKIRHGCRTGTLKKVWEGSKVNKTWEETEWCKNLERKALRTNLSDFDRFKLMKVKQGRNRMIRVEFNKLKKASKKGRGVATQPMKKNGKRLI